MIRVKDINGRIFDLRKDDCRNRIFEAKRSDIQTAIKKLDTYGGTFLMAVGITRLPFCGEVYGHQQL